MACVPTNKMGEKYVIRIEIWEDISLVGGQNNPQKAALLLPNKA